MQKLIIAISAIIALSACKSEKESEFVLKGNFTDSKGEIIYLEKLMNPQPILVDSTSVDENGDFEFKNYTPKIGFYRLKVNDQNFAMLVLDSADKITMKASMKDIVNTYSVEGSPETVLFIEYQQMAKGNRFQTDSLNIAFQSAMQAIKMDSLKMDSLSKIFQPPYETIMNSYHKKLAEKISKNTTMYASLVWIQGLDPEKYTGLYKSLDEGLIKKYPTDKMVRSMHDLISKELATMVGQQAPEIKMATPEGGELALSSFKGKIVLIDFWASWCGPCRKDMPSVVKLYDQYKSKGLEIFGVSLDQDKARWIEAIEKDKITWPQVSDLQYWNSEAAKLYAVQGIPYTVLLDKEGKILAKGLRGPELEKAIENVMAGKPIN